ncbi:aldo/keto reductase [Streptomyces heilongjiangensis]|uniref:aldo/keto reductase n=1 Tax=Streptomyces heilongjiangensis TaxID=945052 RepID=UPI003A93B411
MSRIGLGTLTWGRGTDEHDAADLMKMFWEAGGTLVDTADVYGDGEAAYLLGRLLDGPVSRRDLVISTKAAACPTPTAASTAPAAICSPRWTPRSPGSAPTVDLWHVHAFDPRTPWRRPSRPSTSPSPAAVRATPPSPTSAAGSRPRPRPGRHTGGSAGAYTTACINRLADDLLAAPDDV